MASVTQSSSSVQTKPSGVDLQDTLSVVVRYALMILLGLVLFAPFILSFLGSFKTNSEIIAYPPTLFPKEWQWENWPRFFAADVGGEARLDGAASLGLMAGLFTAFLTFLLTGLTNVIKDRGMARSLGLPLSILVSLLGGAAAAWYLDARIGAGRMETLAVGASIAIIMLIGVLLMGMSNPDWRRVVLALLWSLAAGAVVTILFEQIAMFAGGGRFWRWLFNTAVLSVMMASFQLLFCAMTAYAFARLKFPGRDIIFSFMLATMMIPGAVTLVPAYVLMSKLEWINRAYSLVIPGLVSAGSIFLLTQFLKAVPRDLEEAAYIDGASYFQTFKDVILPLARPALLTVFILQFQGMWNAYLGPLLYLQRRDMWVMNVALQIFQGQYRAELNLLLVAAILNALPVLVLFFMFSRYYIEGVSYAGVKG
ncbi:MAG: carbohydrate ABC transporter permease [Anaerolineales bacterium]|nr:carbohydrate ABC transporter permease [Anaerolineales bacterium]MCB9126621.1 carbohydrate ABC transporter permease [Ardenticatenales bacterium]